MAGASVVSGSCAGWVSPASMSLAAVDSSAGASEC